MKLTLQKAEELLQKIKLFYLSEINQAAERNGGLEKLSISLGYSPKYLFGVIKPPRDTVSALRRILIKIYKKEL